MTTFFTAIAFAIAATAGCAASDEAQAPSVAGVDTLKWADATQTSDLPDMSGFKLDSGKKTDWHTDEDELATSSGEFGAPCAQNSECLSGFCIPNEDGKICTKTCITDCEEGYNCEQTTWTGGDPLYLCFSRYARLCNPCTQHADCNGVESIINKCLDSGPEGKFCGIACVSGATCPVFYQCTEVMVDGVAVNQCVPAKGALCKCNNRAKELGLATVCYNPASPSTCKGARTCTADGLSACVIPAKPEKCNGLDDNCNGETDEGLCDDGNPCTTDSCNTDGSCKHKQLEGTPCDDGNACTTVDKCAAGKCVGGALKLCDDDNACTDDKCDPAGGCLFTSNKDLCDDGNQCTTADKCSEKKCVGGPPPNCNDNNPCTSDSCDTEKGCMHKADTKKDGVTCTDDGNACTVDKCQNGQCKHVAIPGC
ncbi:hypothetical protein HY839_04765 [Candidatus Azambacteria bacterium]|nr:hypothetical protein [Candidatus Azambacteria bacterium]